MNKISIFSTKLFIQIFNSRGYLSADLVFNFNQTEGLRNFKFLGTKWRELASYISAIS